MELDSTMLETVQMKNVILLVLVGLLAVGCSDREAKEVQELKDQVATLEAQVETLNADLRALQLDCVTLFEDSATDASNSLLFLDSIIELAYLVDENTAWIDAVKMRAAQGYSIQLPQEPIRSPSSPAGRTKMGVPVHIYNRIAAEAAVKWPGDYNMQEYEVSNQVDAYLKLNE